MKILYFLLLLSLFGCTAKAEITSHPPLVLIPTAGVEQAATPTPAVASGETAVSSPTQAHFRNLQFRITPQGAAQTSFAAGTEEVFAVWEYANMSEGDMVQRVWTKNGEAWLDRKEVWDSAAYGRNGTVRDISVYDFEGSGLAPGRYHLTLFINGVYQVESGFVVETAAATPTLSASTETELAWVNNHTVLMLNVRDGSQRELARANKIMELLWLSDSQHLLYVDQKEETDPTASPWPKHALWIVNTANGTKWQISSYQENLHRVGFTSGSRFITALAGSDFADACFMDRTLFFVGLNDTFQRVSLHNMRDFAGFPANTSYWFYPEAGGKWENNEVYVATLTALCLSPDMGASSEDLALPGRYQFNIRTLTAVKTDS